MDAGRPNAEEYVALADVRRIDLLEPQDVRGLAVPVLNNRAHLASRRPDLDAVCCQVLFYRTHELLLIHVVRLIAHRT
jgi:hypothetical protein